MTGRRTLPLLALAGALTAGGLSAPAAGAQAPGPPCAPASESGTVDASGVGLAYESFGSCNAEAVVLIGGTGQQLVEWPMELVQALVDRGFRVIRYDNRDAGLSTHLTAAGYPDLAAISAALEQGTPAPVPYTLRDMANDAVGLLDGLGIRQAHLVGLSMGGDIGQLVAIDRPDRVRSLTSIGADSANPGLPVIADPAAFGAVPPPPADGDRAAFVEYQLATYRVLSSPAYPPSDAALRRQVELTVERAYDPAGLVRQQVVTLVGHLERDNYRHANLGRIAAPVAVVQGADDPLQPLASAQELAATIPGAELFVVPGLAHDVPAPLAPLFAAAATRVARRAAGA